MARKVRRTLLVAVVSLIAVVASVIPGAAAGRSGGGCLDARHMALVSNAVHRGVAVDARLLGGCGR
jgi:hypothetical protein